MKARILAVVLRALARIVKSPVSTAKKDGVISGEVGGEVGGGDRGGVGGWAFNVAQA